MNIGKKLKELRESNHCTINELSLSINISEETIISWENNENEPSVEDMLLLNDFYLNKTKNTNITTQQIFFIISIICTILFGSIFIIERYIYSSTLNFGYTLYRYMMVEEYVNPGNPNLENIFNISSMILLIILIVTIIIAIYLFIKIRKQSK